MTLRTISLQIAQRAFTLLELMLAVVIFGMVVAAMNTVFYGAMRLREKTVRSVEEALPIEQTFQVMRKDLQGIVLPTTNGVNGALRSQGTTSGMNQVGSGPEIFTTTGMIEENSSFGCVQKVTYYLKNSTNGNSIGRGKDLFRGVTRNVLGSIQEMPQEQGLMNNVEDLRFSYYDGTQWKETWDSTNEVTVLPRAIKVQLSLASENNSRRYTTPIELLVPIMVQPGTNQTEEALSE